MTEEVEISGETEVAGTTWSEYSETALADGFVDSDEFAELSSYDQALITELIVAQTDAGQFSEVSGTVTITYTSSSSSSSSSNESGDGNGNDEEEEEEEEGPPAIIPVTTSSATSTQTISESSTLTLEDGSKMPWTELRDMFAPSEIFGSEIVQGFPDATRAKLVKLYEAHRDQDGFEDDDWSPLEERYTVSIVTTTRTGPISENSVVAGMTWGEWKAEDDFDLDTFTDSDGYTSASAADKKLFEALIDAQDGDNVLPTSESMTIKSFVANVSIFVPEE